MIAVPSRTIVQKTSVVICLVGYVFMLFMFAVIASNQFSDRRLLATGSKVESTIMTIHPQKGGTSGMISCRLPDESLCNDWTELAPNGVVHPVEALTVAIGQICGSAVSTKKRLAPWVYLGLCIGGVLYLAYVVWKTFRSSSSS